MPTHLPKAFEVMDPITKRFQRYLISYVDSIPGSASEDVHADSDFRKKLVRVCKRYPHSAIRSALLHEFIHCIAFEAGYKRAGEERLVEALTLNFLDALDRQPELRKLLISGSDTIMARPKRPRKSDAKRHRNRSRHQGKHRR